MNCHVVNHKIIELLSIKLESADGKFKWHLAARFWWVKTTNQYTDVSWDIFIIWKNNPGLVWEARPVHVFMSKKNKWFFWKHCSIRTEKLHKIKVFFYRLLWNLKFECIFMKVGNKHLFCYLWLKPCSQLSCYSNLNNCWIIRVI